MSPFVSAQSNTLRRKLFIPRLMPRVVVRRKLNKNIGMARAPRGTALANAVPGSEGGGPVRRRCRRFCSEALEEQTRRHRAGWSGLWRASVFFSPFFVAPDKERGILPLKDAVTDYVFSLAPCPARPERSRRVPSAPTCPLTLLTVRFVIGTNVLQVIDPEKTP